MSRTHSIGPAHAPRPFYVIGHNTNTIEDVVRALDGGANAIEPDIQWSPYLGDLVVWHDPVKPTDSPRSVLSFFRDVARIARERPQLALVVLDSKIDGREHGGRLVRYMREALAGTNLALIYSVAHVSMAGFFADTADQLGAREAVMIDQTDKADDAAAWFWEHGVHTGQSAYGHGIADESGIEASVDHGVALKVQRGLPSWVYIWNLATREEMRDAIYAGVDGIIPSQISDVPVLVNVLREPEMAARVRLATRADNPFTIAATGYTLFVQTLLRDGAGTDANVTFTLHGSTGASLQATITGSKPRRFEQGNLNEISLFGDIGVPISLTVEHDGSGDQSAWLPDIVHVRRTGDPTVYGAGFGDLVKAHEPQSRVLGESRYRLKVFTGDVDKAGTDADITFELVGAGGSVRRRVNGDRQGMFERRAVDDVYLLGVDLYGLQSIVVTNDGSGDRPDWYLGRVEVQRDDEKGSPIVFDFNRWIEAGSSHRAVAHP